jgi:PII-like signaling protein
MLAKGPARKVTIYVNEDTRHHAGPLYQAVLEYLIHKGVAGATVSRAMAGFGSRHTLHTARIETLAEHLPLRIEFIESVQKVEEVLPTLYDMVSDGLIEVQDTFVVRSAAKGREPEPLPAGEEVRGPARLMRIFLGEADEWNGEPLYDAIVKRLRMMDIAGATVYRGILGYGAKGHTHKEKFWHRSRDLPVMISVVDTADKLAEAAKAVETMIGDGLIVFSNVEMVRVVRSRPGEEAAIGGPGAV